VAPADPEADARRCTARAVGITRVPRGRNPFLPLLFSKRPLFFRDNPLLTRMARFRINLGRC
jgi:hypothetical protein